MANFVFCAVKRLLIKDSRTSMEKTENGNIETGNAGVTGEPAR